MTNQPQLPPEVYAAFSDNVNQATLQRIVNSLSLAMGNGAKKVHLFFQSTGGTVGDGIALYNLFKTLPMELVIYNPGSVASIASVAYLGAKTRKTSAHAVFGFHRTGGQTAQPTRATTLQLLAESVAIDDRRTEALIKACTRIPADRWAKIDYGDIWFTALEAVEYGIADEISEFTPPPGTQLYNI